MINRINRFNGLSLIKSVDPEKKLYTIREVADQLDMTPERIRRFIRSAKVPWIDISLRGSCRPMIRLRQEDVFWIQVALLTLKKPKA
jgi:hypothetical protein